jgi:hypothetical protein
VPDISAQIAVHIPIGQTKVLKKYGLKKKFPIIEWLKEK